MSKEKKREEAIKGLERLRDDFSCYKPNEEMFDMAIAALKFQAKAEVVISQLREDRDRLLKILERIEKYLNNPNSGVNGLVHIDDVRGVLEDYEA